MRYFIFSLWILLSVPVVTAQTVDPKFDAYLASERQLLPVDGELLYDCSKLSGYHLVSSSGNLADRRDVDDDTLPFSKAFHINVKNVGENQWEPQFQTPSNQIDIDKGDMLFWVVWAKGIDYPNENDHGRAILYAQLNKSPWTGIASLDMLLLKEWRKFYVYGKAQRDFAKDEMVVTVHLGFFEQELEIGGFIALNLGKGINPDELPGSEVTYVGRDPNAPWRAQAAERIERIRKSDITIQVKNKNDEPVKNASVQVEMKKHAFHFGSFLDYDITESSQRAQNYRDEFLNLFNAATTPFYMGDGNWGWYASESAKNDYREKAEWLESHNLHAKGHVLIWPAWRWMPPFFEEKADNPQELRQALIKHLETVVPVGRDRGVVQWDVVNEPYNNHDVMDILGGEVIADWFNKVHEIHPEARLILNETGVITGGGNPKVQDNLARIVGLLQSKDAALHGLGFQGHFSSGLTSPEKLLEIFDRFAEYGLPLQITEFDINIDDENAQADYTRDFLTTVFSHPAFDKFIMWGFYEPVQWRPRGAMIREDWSYKPNYDAFVALVYEKWWTDENGATNREGVYTTNGFHGTYHITAAYDDATTTLENVKLDTNGLDITIQIPTTETGVSSNSITPDDFYLKPNQPNPFNPSTAIRYGLDKTTNIQLAIYDLHGRLVQELVRGKKSAGEHRTIWNGKDRHGRPVSSGLYLARLEADNKFRTLKMTLLQ